MADVSMKQKKCGKWIVGEPIGDGGQGNVYKTKDSSGKQLAIKIVKIKGGDKKKVARIKREVEIIKQLKDAPNVVKIYDDNTAGLLENAEASQKVYYVMDYAPYGSLRHNDFYLNDVETSLRLFKEILTGLSQAHKQEIIHRDIKPENILLYPTQKGIVVADFGLGRLTAQAEGDNITDSDEILGPRYFMAPEQYKDPSKADERSDIYSLGKVLFYMLTGKGKVFREELGDLSKEFGESNPYLPLIQEKLLRKMVTTDPSKRFGDVAEAIEMVDDILDRVSGNSRRIISKSDDKFSFYDMVIEGRRQEFVDEFSKDLSLNIRILEVVTEELVEGDKQTLLTKLKDELLAKNTSGKAKAAIEATLTYIESPEELQKQASGRYSFASFFLAKYFQNADAHGEAHEHINLALEKEKDSALKLKYLLLLSDICSKCKCSKSHDFSKPLMELLQSATSKETKARLYKMLGEHYKKSGDKAQGLRFIEAYLAIKPYDNDVRFNCAWEYSEIDELPLALHHYQLHEKTAKKSSPSVENNVAVLYHDKELHIKSMELYRKAFEGGNTLAGSNIASRYLSIGMVDEAENILRQIIADNPDGNYDKRVDRVLGSVTTENESEEEQENKLLERGKAINHHHNESIRALTSPQLNWEGYWKLDLGPIIEIKRSAKGLTAHQRAKDSKDPSIIFKGNTATVSGFEKGYTKYNSGVLYLTAPGKLKGYVQKKDGDYEEVTGEFIPDIKQYDEHNAGALRRLLQGYQDLRP